MSKFPFFIDCWTEADFISRRAKLYIAKRGLVASITVSMRTGKDIAKDARLKMPAEDFEWTRILSCLLEQGTGENPVELEALDVSNLMAFGNVNDATVTVSRALSEAKERQQGFQLLLKMFKAGITRQVIHRLTKRDSEEHLGSQLKIET